MMTLASVMILVGAGLAAPAAPAPLPAPLPAPVFTPSAPTDVPPEVSSAITLDQNDSKHRCLS